jgi:hypothetical protein
LAALLDTTPDGLEQSDEEQVVRVDVRKTPNARRPRAAATP